MGWLQEHLEQFVKPVLGYIPSDKDYPAHFDAGDLTRIKNAWRSVKTRAGDKKIILPGRDVWIFEVLARRDGTPTWFIPQCSRMAVSQIEIDDIDKYYIVDTGFMGSIPKALKAEDFALLSYHRNKTDKEVQVFPTMGGSRGLALKVEKTPKYWKTGFIRDGLVGQELSEPEEFAKAAALTQQVYKNSAPKFTADRLTKHTGGFLWTL